MLLLRMIRHVFSPVYNWYIRIYKRIAAGTCKIEPKFCVSFITGMLVIVKNTTNAKALIVAVRVYKIIIAMLFESGIKSWIELVANIFISLVKINGIFFKKVIGGKIGATPKPAVYDIMLLIVQFKHTV